MYQPSSYTIYSESKQWEMSAINVSELRNQKHQFDIWVDLFLKDIFVKEIGSVDFSQKKLLLKLLTFFITNCGKKFTPEEIFSPVWNMSISDFSEEQSVKTAISRLRKMIEPDDSMWKFIVKTDPRYRGRRGEYYFNPEINYCLVRPNGLFVYSS